MSADPLTASTLVDDTSVMAVPLGATSGTRSQALTEKAAASSIAASHPAGPERRAARPAGANIVVDIMNMDMELRSRSDDRGYLLAVLLIGMAIAAVWAAAALPAWRHQVQREREMELIFRGEQYARAVALYYLKNNRTLPGDMDMLVTGHYLRKKWKDPVTGEDFVPMIAGGAAPGTPPGTPPPAGQPPPQQQQGQPAPSGIFGVSSKSSATSIIVYQNLQQHSQWAFTYQAYCQKYRVNCNPQQGPPGQRGNPRAPEALVVYHLADPADPAGRVDPVHRLRAVRPVVPSGLDCPGAVADCSSHPHSQSA